MAFSILTDTSANLPAAFVREHAIRVVPFTYFRGEQAFTCLNPETFDPSAYYGAMRSGEHVTTSQIVPQTYIDLLRPMLAQGEEVLFVGMSSGVSGSFHSAELAREELLEEFPDAKLRLVDSLGASLGEGLLVLDAVEARAQGLSLDETAERLLALRSRVCQVFTVDDLMYLHKGGRVSGTAAVVGTVLNIKPILKGNEHGKIVTTAKVRSRKRAIEALAAKYDALVQNADTQTVCIAHADCADDAEALQTLLRRNHPPKAFLTVDYEPVTGAHVGPGALALFFLSDADVRTK